MCMPKGMVLQRWCSCLTGGTSSPALVRMNGKIDVPVLVFSSDGQGTGWREDAWSDFQRNFIADSPNGRLVD